MSKKSAHYAVTIAGTAATIRKLGARERDMFGETIIRQRDALELFRSLQVAGKGLDGEYVFQFLDTARTFAMLHLEARERAVQDNLDRVLAYDGAEGSSDDA